MSGPIPTRPPPGACGAHVWILAGLAMLVLVSAVGVVLAPVTADDPVVSWPRAGERPSSTVLPLVPYRPLALDATVPCATLGALDERAGGGEALRTLPAGVDIPPRPGLTVAVADGTVSITASGAEVLVEPLGQGCTYRVVADAGGVRVQRDGAEPVTVPGLPVPQVAQLATEAEGLPAADGLAVELHTDARYESVPSTLKTVLLALYGLALLALLVVASRVWRGQDPGGQVPGGGGPPPAAPRPGPVDAVLLGVSAVWVLLSPVNFDDSWYLLMARGAASSGAVGNTVYMFNAAENPFVASQYLMQVWGELGGWGLAWMRLLPLAFGLLTWVLLRWLLASVLGREHGSGVAPWALLVAHLLWWLPYGMTLRPEPLIVVFAAAVLLLAELARRRRSVGALACATTCAALAVTVSPSGLVAAAPLVLAVPWLWSRLRVQSWPGRVAAVLVLGAAATALVPVGFADATLGDVLESTAVRQWYYLTFSWYEEIVHYQTVLTLPDSSQWARRAPVVLTVAVLAVVAVGSGRQTTDDPVRRLLLTSAVASAIALGLLSLTPTKFVNHFGAAAAAPTVLLAAALLRAPLPRQVGAVAAIGGTALLVGAVSLSYAGPNLWRPYSDRGQPFGNHLLANGTPAQLAELSPRTDTLYLRNPLIWITLALLAASWMWWRRRQGRTTTLTPDRAVLVLGSTSIVLLTLVVFAAAPVRQYPGWTVALSTVNAVRGESCGLASHVRVLVDAEQQPGAPVGEAEVTGGFAAATTRPSPAPPPVPDTQVWHGSAPNGPETGAVATPWYPLPARGDATHLVVPLLGAELAEQRVELEYATTPGGPAAGALEIEPDSGVAAGDWQEVPVALERLGTLRPVSVRVVVEDRATAPGAFVAVAAPRLAVARPIPALTAGRPVYADQVSAALWPCVDQVAVEHGIAQAPAVHLRGDEGFPRGFLDLAFEVGRGGTLVQADRTGTAVRVAAELVPSGPPTLPWGRVERVVYDHPVGLVDVEIRRERRTGWTRLPTLSGEDYNGYQYVG